MQALQDDGNRRHDPYSDSMVSCHVQEFHLDELAEAEEPREAAILT